MPVGAAACDVSIEIPSFAALKRLASAPHPLVVNQEWPVSFHGARNGA
jgi:hypothetical protein